MNRQLTHLIVLAGGIGLGAGLAFWLAPGDSDPPAADAGTAAPEILYWVAPMDANYRRDGPGKSPMGMDLVPVYADKAGKGGGVTVAPEVRQSLGVRTASVERDRLWRLVRAVGQVDLDESGISHVHPRTSGWLEELLVDAAGDPVTAGDAVARLYSPELVSAQRELIQALERGNDAVHTAAEEKLRVLGMGAAERRQLMANRSVIEVVELQAPRDGVISELNVRAGMYVTPDTELLSVSDLRRVWVRADVFEAQADWLAIGQSAELRLDYLPGRVFDGEVDLIEPVVNPRTRTVRVRLRFDNAEGTLLPGMYGKLRIYGGPKTDILVMPLDALIRGEAMDRVVVSAGDGRFEVQEVRVGMVSGDWVEILAGVDVGDEVVVSAQFLIDSEASVSGGIRRLGGSGHGRGREGGS
ncbi:MAG: efflux RND transporter periplasmic adaptor subunit [Pseudomonadota bacterium]